MFSRLWVRLPRDPLGVPLSDSRASLRLSRELRTVLAWTRIYIWWLSPLTYTYT